MFRSSVFVAVILETGARKVKGTKLSTNKKHFTWDREIMQVLKYFLNHFHATVKIKTNEEITSMIKLL